MSIATILDARGLHTYYGSSHVLQGVDFAVGAGELVALMGRHGMGNTTLIRSLIGLVRTRAGEVPLAGAPISGLAPFRSRGWAWPTFPWARHYGARKSC
jgi:branched-chain amino acid transport system ATP-binding protein